MFNLNAIIMKKIFSFLVLFVLSFYMTADLLAQTPDCPVKFSDDIDRYPYNIGFVRSKRYWTLDHSVSSTITQEVALPENDDDIQRWEFVLVAGSEDEFYIRSASTGEYVTYHTGGEGNQFIDSYGQQVPLTTYPAHAVYYADGEVTPHSFKLAYREDLGGWVFMDQSGSSLNGRNSNDGYSLCKYGPDAGNVLILVEAGVPNVTPSTTSLILGSLVDKKTENRITVSGRFLPEDISLAIEGDDAANFSYRIESDTETGFQSGSIFIGFTPSELRTTPYSATLKLTCGVGEAKVALTGNAYPDSDMPKISEEGGEEHWYYIQFKFDMTDQVNLAWTSSQSQGQVTREQITPGSFNDAQLWKICGNWDEGFYFVNKALGGEFAYNQGEDKNPILSGLTYQGAESGGPDIYYVTDGFGAMFNFVKDKNGYWQLYNRDINSAPTSTTRTVDGYDARYAYARHFTEGYDLIIRQSAENVERTQVIFTEVAARIIPPAASHYTLKAEVGANSSVDLAIVGSGLQGNVTATLTNNSAFSLSSAVLPGTGGTLTVNFDPTSADEIYADTLTLSSPGASDVKMFFVGSTGKPVLSLENDSWHYIQFSRRAGDKKVWQANGIGVAVANKISQKVKVEGDHNQQWRFVGTEDNLIIQNRATGGYLTFKGSLFPSESDPDAVLTDNEKDATVLAIVRDAEKDTWALKDLAKGNGLNDRSANYVCHYGITDGGSLFNFLPAEYEAVGRKLIVSDKASVLVKASTTKASTATLKVSSIGVDNTISVAVTGEGFDVSPKTLPAEGGDLTITFAQTEANKEFSGSLTLSSVGVEKTVEVSLTGITAPAFSDDLDQTWYYIQFERSIANTKLIDGLPVNQNAVWQGNGIGENITQEPFVLGETSQHWKLVGNWDDSFKIVNFNGGEVAFFGYDDEKGRVDGFGSLTDGGDGDPMAFVPESNKWAFWLYEYYDADDSWGCLNDYNGDASDLGIYSTGDAGSYVRFIPIDGGDSINDPIFDPNDREIAKKFYTLQGMEVKAPTTTGVYIVKKIYESGKTKAVKEIIIVK